MLTLQTFRIYHPSSQFTSDVFTVPASLENHREFIASMLCCSFKD